MHIDKLEVLRYLGHHNQAIDENLNKLIEECIAETTNLADLRYIYQTYSIIQNKPLVKLQECALVFKGKDITRHLEGSLSCAVMAVTLGIDIERKIKTYEKTNLTKALILDACATTAVEAGCDEVEEVIKREAQQENLFITSRFSPGYGDLDIAIQPLIIQTLQTQKKIGLTCTDDAILIPRKSVTAIIGLQNTEGSKEQVNCCKCNKRNECQFTKGGSYCGN